MNRVFGILLLVLALCVGSAQAAPIVVGSGTSFNSSTYAGQFFTNASWDGSGCGVGNFIAGTGHCSQPNFYNGSPLATLPFLGSGQTEFVFAGDPTTVTFLSGVSAHVDEFGWVASGTNTYVPLFTNGAPRNTTASFDASGLYALYFLDYATGARWRSDVLGDTQTHFALFRGKDAYYLGMEDLSSRHTDFDYNDTIVKLTTEPEPVPEPGSMLLFGTGLFAVGRRIRKRN